MSLKASSCPTCPQTLWDVLGFFSYTSLFVAAGFTTFCGWLPSCLKRLGVGLPIFSQGNPHQGRFALEEMHESEIEGHQAQQDREMSARGLLPFVSRSDPQCQPPVTLRLPSSCLEAVIVLKKPVPRFFWMETPSGLGECSHGFRFSMSNSRWISKTYI